MATFTVGYTTTPTAGAGNNYTANYNFANGVYTMPQDGIITSCSVWLDTGPTGTMQIGIYSSISATQPGTLLAKTAQFSPVAGWNTVNTTTNVTVAGGTNLWMGAVDTVSDLTKADANAGFSLYSNAGGTPTLATTFANPATLQASNFQLGAYATFNVPVPTLFPVPSVPNPLVRDYRSALASTTIPIGPLLTGNVIPADVGSPGKARVGYFRSVMSTTQPVRSPTVPVTRVPILIQAPYSDMPIRPDYSRALASTTQPVVPTAFRTAITPATYFFPRVEERPLVVDVIGKSLAASTQPVQPRAPPVLPSLLGLPESILPTRMDYSRTLGATTSPVAPIFVPATPPSIFAPVPDYQLPLRSDYWRAIGSTTQPVGGPRRAGIIFDQTSTHANNGGQGLHWRQVIPLANLTNPGYSSGRIRVSFTLTATTVSGNLDVAYIGAGIASPNYDFDGSQVQLFFGGSASKNGMNGAITFTSDFAPFDFNFSSAVSLVVATHWSGTEVDTLSATVAGCHGYYLAEAVGTEGQSAPAGAFTTSTEDLTFNTTIEFEPFTPQARATVLTPDPIRPDYLRALWATTQPTLVVAPAIAITPSISSVLALQDDRPGRSDYSRTLTAQPVLPVFIPPPVILTLVDRPDQQLPPRSDPSRALGSTTQPVLVSTFVTAITPTLLFEEAIPDERPKAFDYRVALASTTSPVAPIFIPPAVIPLQNLIGAPDSQLPLRADYSRTLAASSPVTAFPLNLCFNVGYAITPTAGAGNSYTAGYVFGNGPYTMPQTGIITSCSVWLDTGPVGQFQLGIYDSISSSQPGNLLAVTGLFTPSAGWNTQPVTFPTPVASGTVIFMGALNFNGPSPTKADATVGINLYSNKGTSSVLDPVFLNPDVLSATSFQLGAYATFCPTVSTTSNWFQTPYQANPIAKDYRVALGDTTQPTQWLGAALPPPPAATPAYLGIAISGEVPTGGDSRAALASTTRPVSPVYSPTIAFSNQFFLNSLGATTHMDQGFSEASYEPMFAYTGIRVAREGASAYVKLQTLHNNTISGTYPGVKALIGAINPGTTATTPNYGITAGLALDAIGALVAFEGMNEPNNQLVTYNGVTGGGSNSWVPVAQLQRDTYLAVSGNSTLSKYPVFGASEMGAEFDNVGLQYNKIPVGAGTSFPDGTVYQDYANIHNYVLGSSTTLAAGQPTASMSIGNIPGGVDGRLGEYIGTTWLKHFPAYSAAEGPSVPFVTTETGANTGGANLTEDQQGRLYVNLYLAGFQAQMATGQKVAFTGIYEMSDSFGTLGIYTGAGVAKLSATYIHNFTTVLADVGPDPTPRSLDFTVVGETSTCHHLLLQKSDNTFYLILWGEEVVGGPTHSVTVNLTSSWNINVYDVVSGTSPTSVLQAVSSVSLTMQDHAKILRISPVHSDAGPSQPRNSKRRTTVFSTTSPVGVELLPTPVPQSLYWPGGVPRDLPSGADYRTALLSTTSPVGPALLPTPSLFGLDVWVNNPDSTMPDWW